MGCRGERNLSGHRNGPSRFVASDRSLKLEKEITHQLCGIGMGRGRAPLGSWHVADMIGLSFPVGSEDSHSSFPFNDLDDAVDAWEGDFFTQAAGPEDFELVDFGGGAEAKVEARVGSGGVATAAEDVAALADTTSSEEDLSADGVARGTLSWFLGR